MSSDLVLTEREFYMARHGETNHNAANLVSGEDAVLTQRGRKQAATLNKVLAEHFSPMSQCYFVVSDLPRAKHTAEIAADGAEMIIDPRLNERNNGVLGGKVSTARLGKLRRTLRQRNPEDVPAYKGVQTYDHHTDSVISAVNEHLGKCPPDKMPVVVSHYGTMNRVAEMTGCSPVTFTNGGLYHFMPDPVTHRWTITQVTLDHEHVTERPVAASPMSFKPGETQEGRYL